MEEEHEDAAATTAREGSAAAMWPRGLRDGGGVVYAPRGARASSSVAEGAGEQKADRSSAGTAPRAGSAFVPSEQQGEFN